MREVFSTVLKFDLLKVGHCQHSECAALRGGSRRAIDFPALVGLMEHPRLGLMLYDTGYSQHFNKATQGFPECLYRWVTPVTLPPEEELLTQLAARGIRASDIETIFISHFHADHVAGLKDFPKARFIATRKEHEASKSWGRLTRLCRAYLREMMPADMEQRMRYAEDAATVDLPERWSPFTSAHDVMADGSVLGLDLPGHTASQLGLAFAAESMGEVFLVGDACWKIEGLENDQRPSRLAYALFDGGKAYDETFGKLRALHGSEGRPQIIPSHCLRTWNELGGSRRVVRV